MNWLTSTRQPYCATLLFSKFYGHFVWIPTILWKKLIQPMQILWLAVTFAKEHDLQVSAIDTALQDVRTFTVNKGSLTKVRIYWLSIFNSINWAKLFHDPLPDLPTTYKTRKLVKPLPKGMIDLFGKFVGDCFPRFPHWWVVDRSDRWWSSWWSCLHRKNLGNCGFLLDFSNAQFFFSKIPWFHWLFPRHS